MELTLYSRLYCSLCEQMLAAIRQHHTEDDFILNIVDIDEDKTLQQRFNADVPLLASDNDIICRHFYNQEALTRYLRQNR